MSVLCSRELTSFQSGLTRPLSRMSLSREEQCPSSSRFPECVLESFPPKIILLKKAKEERGRSSCRSLQRPVPEAPAAAEVGSDHESAVRISTRADGVTGAIEEESERPAPGFPSGPALVRKGSVEDRCAGPCTRARIHGGVCSVAPLTSLLSSLGADLVLSPERTGCR